MSDVTPAGGSDRHDDLARMAGNVAHDLNNLLTSIKGLASLALQELPGEHPLRRDIEEIQTAAVRATTLTAQLKSMARGAWKGAPPATATLTSGTSESGGRIPAPMATSVPAGASAAPRNPPPPGGVQVVLVADDEDSIRKLVARVLERAGYHVLQARDTSEALELAESAGGRIDLLLTDVVMPRTGGQHLYQLIRDRWPGVRVLYMSGYTDDPVVRREAQEGGGYLGKPFAPEDLIATVRRVLDRDSQPLADR